MFNSQHVKMPMMYLWMDQNGEWTTRQPLVASHYFVIKFCIRLAFKKDEKRRRRGRRETMGNNYDYIQEIAAL